MAHSPQTSHELLERITINGPFGETVGGHVAGVAPRQSSKGASIEEIM